MATPTRQPRAPSKKEEGDIADAVSTNLAAVPRPLHDTEIRAIAEREQCLHAITMQLQIVRRVRGQATRLSGRICELFQWRMAKCLVALRLATLRVVEAAVAWRADLVANAEVELHGVPEPMVHGGVNYLLKVLTDLCWLPLPGASDPFLIRWFGREAHWWNAAHGKLCPPSSLQNGSRQGNPSPFALDLLAPAPEGEVSDELMMAMSEAEGVLKAEADIYGFAPPDGMEPPHHLVELSREMELLMYGGNGMYEATLIKILDAHAAGQMPPSPAQEGGAPNGAPGHDSDSD